MIAREGILKVNDATVYENREMTGKQDDSLIS